MFSYLVYEKSGGAKEQLLGFGKQFAYSFFDNVCVPIISQGQGVGRGLQPLSFFLNRFASNAAGSWQNTYSAEPHYVALNSLTSIGLENKGLLVFDSSHKNGKTLSVHGMFKEKDSNLGLAGFLYGGYNLQDLVKQHTFGKGRMRPFPNWLAQNGILLGVQGGTDKVLANLQKVVSAGINISALYIQVFLFSPFFCVLLSFI